MKRLSLSLTVFLLPFGIFRPVAAQQRLVSSFPTTDIFRGVYSETTNVLPQAVDLRTTTGQSVLTFSKEGLLYEGNFYKLVKKEKGFSLESPTASQPLGTIATSWRTFTLPNGQVFTQKKQKGAQLAFASAGQPVAAIQYKKDKHQKGKEETYSVSIENKGNNELAPFLFLATVNHIYTYESQIDWYLSYGFLTPLLNLPPVMNTATH
ncbi:hypothetical protein [Hymenobacter terrenus]|uniref:hypothetical protein n=1 Tax=Hymenobacter terrenus TaxID=1629124 RepID=UPI000619079A|nr:hypothetical protein [Hymenobacter terrenus]